MSCLQPCSQVTSERGSVLSAALQPGDLRERQPVSFRPYHLALLRPHPSISGGEPGTTPRTPGSSTCISPPHPSTSSIHLSCWPICVSRFMTGRLVFHVKSDIIVMRLILMQGDKLVELSGSAFDCSSGGHRFTYVQAVVLALLACLLRCPQTSPPSSSQQPRNSPANVWSSCGRHQNLLDPKLFSTVTQRYREGERGRVRERERERKRQGNSKNDTR